MSCEDRLGRCYELAFERCLAGFIRDGSEARLVHGVIRDTRLIGAGAVICHAWVEQDGMVWEPITEAEMTADAFMRLFDAEVVHSYPARSAWIMGATSGHSGPWDEMPDDIQRTLTEIEEAQMRRQA